MPFPQFYWIAIDAIAGQLQLSEWESVKVKILVLHLHQFITIHLNVRKLDIKQV